MNRGSWSPFVVSLLLAWPTLAQEGTNPPPPAAPAPAPAAAQTVVVVADPYDDETENAKLRARVYEAARGRGLTPDSKAEVISHAETAGVMRAGKVSTEDADLEKLRVALGASALIRVARDPGGMKVTLIRSGGATSRVVASVDGVVPAATELLGGKPGAPAAPAAPVAGAPAGPVTAGTITAPPKDQEEERDLTDPKQLSAAWENRGGVRASYGVRAVLSGLIIEDAQYASTNPETLELDRGHATTYGIGAGVGVHVSMMYLPLPQPRTDSASWAAFRIGVGLDVSGFYERPPKGYSYKTLNGVVQSRDTEYENKAYVFGVIPMQVGVMWGFGDFRLPTLWRGLALGVAYSPSFLVWMDVDKDQDAIESRFNYAGFELSLDIAKIEADSGSQPHIRLSALILPKVADDLPWLGSVGIGAVWY